MEIQSLRNMRNFFACKPLKIFVEIVLPISIFFFILSYFLVLNFQFPSLQALNKNCMFLICNGLLVFLAKTSSLVPSSLGFDLGELQILFEIKEPLLEKEVLVENDGVEAGEEKEERELLNADDGQRTGNRRGDCHFEGEVPEIELLSAGGCARDSGGGGAGGRSWHCDDEEMAMAMEIKNENDLFSEEEEELMSTEELNKKFEDFIERTKQEIRIGAQQLILVK